MSWQCPGTFPLPISPYVSGVEVWIHFWSNWFVTFAEELWSDDPIHGPNLGNGPELSRVVPSCCSMQSCCRELVHWNTLFCSMAGTFHWRGQVPAARRARTSAVRDLRRSTVFCFLGFHMGFPYLREVAELIWHDLRFHPWDRRLFSGHTTGLGESTPYSTFMTWWVAPFFERMICKESPLNWWLNTKCDEYVVETP